MDGGIDGARFAIVTGVARCVKFLVITAVDVNNLETKVSTEVSIKPSL